MLYQFHPSFITVQSSSYGGGGGGCWGCRDYESNVTEGALKNNRNGDFYCFILMAIDLLDTEFIARRAIVSKWKKIKSKTNSPIKFLWFGLITYLILFNRNRRK